MSKVVADTQVSTAYYRSAADDERSELVRIFVSGVTADETSPSTAFSWNRDAFSTIRFRPRVLRNVRPVDLTTSIVGHRSTMPVYISPAAMGRLAHTEGEKCLARTAAAHGIPYIVSARNVRIFSSLTVTHCSLSVSQVSANSSVSFEDLAAEVPKDTLLFYQVR